MDDCRCGALRHAISLAVAILGRQYSGELIHGTGNVLKQTLQKGFHGAETEVRVAPGVRLVHVGHPPGQHIDLHAHDWACLTIFRCGSYTEQIARGEIVIEGPAVAFIPPDTTTATGLVQEDWKQRRF